MPTSKTARDKARPMAATHEPWLAAYFLSSTAVAGAAGGGGTLQGAVLSPPMQITDAARPPTVDSTLRTETARATPVSLSPRLHGRLLLHKPGPLPVRDIFGAGFEIIGLVARVVISQCLGRLLQGERRGPTAGHDE